MALAAANIYPACDYDMVRLGKRATPILQKRRESSCNCGNGMLDTPLRGIK